MVEEIGTSVPQSESVAKRGRSTIAFPYGDLNNAVEVARAIYKNSGDQCTIEQLAAWLGHDSVDSGAFNLKMATARTFGLIETSRGQVSLTPSGTEIVDPQREHNARVQAFLHVPLYQEIFEKYKGRLLPPDVGLEREMVNLGVSPKQKDKARQAFQRSAEQAGFFSQGRDRLVLPVGSSSSLVESPQLETAPLPSAEPTTRHPRFGAGGTGGGSDHPLLQGLFETLPEPGTVWSDEERREWLDAAEKIFGLVYKKTRTVSSSSLATDSPEAR